MLVANSAHLVHIHVFIFWKISSRNTLYNIGHTEPNDLVFLEFYKIEMALGAFVL